MTKPTALYKDDFKPVNSFETCLKNLDMIENTTVEYFKKSCETAEQDFAQ